MGVFALIEPGAGNLAASYESWVRREEDVQSMADAYKMQMATNWWVGDMIYHFLAWFISHAMMLAIPVFGELVVRGNLMASD